MWKCHGVYIEVRGQLSGIIFLLPFRLSLGLNSGCDLATSAFYCTFLPAQFLSHVFVNLACVGAMSDSTYRIHTCIAIIYYSFSPSINTTPTSTCQHLFPALSTLSSPAITHPSSVSIDGAVLATTVAYSPCYFVTGF